MSKTHKTEYSGTSGRNAISTPAEIAGEEQTSGKEQISNNSEMPAAHRAELHEQENMLNSPSSMTQEAHCQEQQIHYLLEGPMNFLSHCFLLQSILHELRASAFQLRASLCASLHCCGFGAIRILGSAAKFSFGK